MSVRGIRGAITANENSAQEIIRATGVMLDELIKRNGISLPDIASALFTVTNDLDAEFPAVAARKLGWLYTPLACATEIPVPGSLPLCIRVLLHVNSTRRQDEMVHCYLDGARALRPDLDLENRDRYYISEPL